MRLAMTLCVLKTSKRLPRRTPRPHERPGRGFRQILTLLQQREMPFLPRSGPARKMAAGKSTRLRELYWIFPSADLCSCQNGLRESASMRRIVHEALLCNAPLSIPSLACHRLSSCSFSFLLKSSEIEVSETASANMVLAINVRIDDMGSALNFHNGFLNL